MPDEPTNLIRTVFVTQDEPLYLPVFFKHFLPLASRRESPVDIRGAVILDTHGGSHLATGAKLLGVYGPTAFAQLLWRYARTMLGKLRYDTGIRDDPVTVSQWLGAFDIDTWPIDDVNDSEMLRRVERERIDAVLSVASPQIFGEKLLEKPTFGCINSHSAPLPRYRGMMPVFWSLLHDEPELTVTIHRMTEEIDEGKILEQRSIDTYPSMSLDRGIRRTKRLSAEAMYKVLQDLAEGDLCPEGVPDDTESSYFSFPSAADGRRFRQTGNSFF